MNKPTFVCLALATAMVSAGCMTDPQSSMSDPESTMAEPQASMPEPQSSMSGMQTDPPSEPSTHTSQTIHMQELDRNSDRVLTRDELEADHKLAIDFARYDANGDGEIDEHEFREYVGMNTD